MSAINANTNATPKLEPVDFIKAEGANAMVTASGAIEVWDTEWVTHFGTLPAGTSVEVINCAVRFFKSGFVKGEEYGLRVQAHNSVFQG